jgi:transposase InsO family protein
MRVIHRQYKGRYGSPRMTEELGFRGMPCGKHRVAHLMRQAGIRAKAPRRFRVTTDSDHGLPVAVKSSHSDSVRPEYPTCRSFLTIFDKQVGHRMYTGPYKGDEEPVPNALSNWRAQYREWNFAQWR